VHQLFIDFMKAYDSLYNILIEFGITMILVRLIKGCSKVNFLFRTVWNKEMFCRHSYSALL